MIHPFQVAAAFGLDLVLGDPVWLPHPVRVIGRTAAVLEKGLRQGVVRWTGERWAGVILAAVVVLSSYGTTYFVLKLCGWIHPGLEVAAGIYFAFTTLAVKSLGDEARGVFDRLQQGDLISARQWLSRIVGRETHQLSGSGVIRATVETVAENSSDGVVAPLFYLALGGAPLAMAYKAVNTLDSMVGYPTPRYRDFGWASARLDDLANYLPARLTGLLMVAAAGLLFGQGRRAWRIMRRDGRKHDSPNAGIPEAAAAGALGVQLGGPSRLAGLVKEKPWLGEAVREPAAEDIRAAIRIMQSVSLGMLLLCMAVIFIFQT